MKSIFTLGVPSGILFFAMIACDTQDDSLKVEREANQTQKEKTQFTCHDLLESPDEFNGKTVSLNAISWGTNSSVDGEEILMSIDDDKLEGLQQSHVLVHFSKEQKEEIENIHENDSVRLNATVGEFKAGALRLIDAKIRAKKDEQ